MCHAMDIADKAQCAVRSAQGIALVKVRVRLSLRASSCWGPVATGGAGRGGAAWAVPTRLYCSVPSTVSLSAVVYTICSGAAQQAKHVSRAVQHAQHV